MKSVVLAGVIGAILLTASVVVGFFQHAAFVNQKSNHRGSRCSSSQVDLSVGNSDANDLSSLLQTAKSDFAMSASNSASAIGNSVNAPETVTDLKDPIHDILMDAQATLQHTAPMIAVDEGKALPLSSFLKATAAGGVPSGFTTAANWDATKSNLDLLKSNTVRLAGQDPSKFNFDFSSIQQVINDLPPVATAIAAGTALIIVGASSKKTKPPKKNDSAVTSSEEIQSTSAVIGGLTDELETLQNRMKVLEETGLDLDKELNDAKSKLTQKELDVSKAKLEAADTSLALNREIDLLKQKLDDNDERAKTLDRELNKALQKCESLVKELEESKIEQAKKAAEESRIREKKAAEAAEKQKAEEIEKRKQFLEMALKKQYLEAAMKKQAATKTVSKAKSEARPTAETPVKRAVQRQVTTQKSAPNRGDSGVWTSSEELPSATPVKKVAVKNAEAKNEDLTTLSKSALNRITVKVLAEFLESRGITTTDESGKTMKKALLLEAVRSL